MREKENNLTLEVRPKSWWSWTFRVYDNGTHIGEMNFSWWREAGALQIGNSTYRLYREGRFRGLFILEENGKVLACAEKPSALAGSFNVRCGSRTYVLEAASIFRRKFVLRETSGEIGSISPERACYRNALIYLPVELSLPVRLFMAWLTLLLWKREADSAGVIT